MGRAGWLAIIVGVLLGITIGVGGFTFGYAQGASYLGHDARACANCHIMNEQYDGWLKSSHRAVAACNDCHTPPGLVAKYLVKASNGFWHSYAFTSGDFHEPIRIKASNRAVTEQACRHCHADMVNAMAAGRLEQVSCINCHNRVGHAEPTPNFVAR